MQPVCTPEIFFFFGGITLYKTSDFPTDPGTEKTENSSTGSPKTKYKKIFDVLYFF